jgi:hypothetical protein
MASEKYTDSFFVEMDLATESTTRITEKARAYRLYWQSGREQATEAVFPTVLFIVPSTGRKVQLTDALSRQPAEYWHLFQVVTADVAARTMTTGELINNNQQEEVKP